MRALPRPSRITILAVCLAAALAIILVIGCMRGLDTSPRQPGQSEAPRPVAPAGQPDAPKPDAQAAPEKSGPTLASDGPPALDPSPFSHMVEPLAARLFVIFPDVRPTQTPQAGATPSQPQSGPGQTPDMPAASPKTLAALPDADAGRKAAPASSVPAPSPGKTASPGPEPTAGKVSKTLGRTVLVVGDSFAVGIGMTLADSLRGAAEIRLEQKGKTSSGLDNVKFHNWGKTLDELLATARPDALVVMIGGNDAQNGPGTEVWADSYRQKAGDFLGIAARKNVPVYWVALPPMRDTGLNARVKTTNAAMRAACESGPNCRFIDAWDLFSDDKGEFAAEKNLGGKTVKLRGKDGVHFTMAGYRLLSDRVLDGFAPNLEISQKK